MAIPGMASLDTDN